jgi:hypothetical protein
MTRREGLIGLFILSVVGAPGAISAQVQTAEQAKCLKALNKAGKKVALKQGKENQLCLKNAGKGKITDLQRCSVEDGKNRVEKARSKTTKDETKKCVATPDFGYTGAETVNAAAASQEAGLLADLFGTDVNPAVILKDNDKDGAKCQSSVLRETDKLLQAKLQEFFVCTNAGLKNKLTPITSAAGLEECLHVVAADPKGKVAKKTAKLTKVMGKACASQDLNTAFPGVCAGAADFVGCVEARVNCRTCLMLNLMHGLDADCEVYDDGQSNNSCVALVPDRYATIQQAIDAVPDGGTVLVKPGIYTEAITVFGKRVDLIGSGSAGRQRTEIAGAPPRSIPDAYAATGVITYGGGGGGRLVSFALRYGQTAVLGAGATAPLGPVHIEDVVISESARGILGEFSELIMNGVTITDTAGPGASVLCFEEVYAKYVKFQGAGGVGMVIRNCLGSEIIEISGEFSDNARGGLAIVGDDATIGISDTVVSSNEDFGILFFLTGKAVISNTQVLATTDTDGPYGDGILAVGSGPVLVFGSSSTSNQRGGIMIFGCSPENQTDLSAASTVLSFNRWGLAAGKEQTYSAPCSVGCPGAVFNDLGGNSLTANSEKDFKPKINCGLLDVPTTPAVPAP